MQYRCLCKNYIICTTYKVWWWIHVQPFFFKCHLEQTLKLASKLAKFWALFRYDVISMISISYRHQFDESFLTGVFLDLRDAVHYSFHGCKWWFFYFVFFAIKHMEVFLKVYPDKLTYVHKHVHKEIDWSIRQCIRK